MINCFILSVILEIHRKLCILEFCLAMFIISICIRYLISEFLAYYMIFVELELFYVILPICLMFVLISCLFVSLTLLFEYDVFGSNVNVCGFQWYWLVDNWLYSLHAKYLVFGSIRLLDSSHSLLCASSIHYAFLITSFDVIHSLSFPALGFKLDAIPGRLSVGYIECFISGIYFGQCTELCGSLHAFMPIKVVFI